MSSVGLFFQKWPSFVVLSFSRRSERRKRVMSLSNFDQRMLKTFCSSFLFRGVNKREEFSFSPLLWFFLGTQTLIKSLGPPGSLKLEFFWIMDCDRSETSIWMFYGRLEEIDMVLPCANNARKLVQNTFTIINLNHPQWRYEIVSNTHRNCCYRRLSPITVLEATRLVAVFLIGWSVYHRFDRRPSLS